MNIFITLQVNSLMDPAVRRSSGCTERLVFPWREQSVSLLKQPCYLPDLLREDF